MCTGDNFPPFRPHVGARVAVFISPRLARGAPEPRAAARRRDAGASPAEPARVLLARCEVRRFRSFLCVSPRLRLSVLCADGSLYIVVGKQSASPLIFKNCVFALEEFMFNISVSSVVFAGIGSLKAEPFLPFGEDRLTN